MKRVDELTQSFAGAVAFFAHRLRLTAAMTTTPLGRGSDRPEGRLAQDLPLGLFGGDDAEETIRNAEPMKKLLEEKLGITVEVFTGTSYGAVIEAMRAKRVDAMTVGPFAYVLAVQEAGAEALAISISTTAKEPVYDPTLLPYYISVVFTKKGNGINTLDDIKGKGFNFVDPASASGHLAPKTALIKKGYQPGQGLADRLRRQPPDLGPLGLERQGPGRRHQREQPQEPATTKARSSGAPTPDGKINKPRTEAEMKAHFDSCPNGTIVDARPDRPDPEHALRGAQRPARDPQGRVKAALLTTKDDPEFIKARKRWYVDPRATSSCQPRPLLQPAARHRQAAQPRPQRAGGAGLTMDREQRLEAISLADMDADRSLADQVLETLDVEVARGPSVGLLMVRAEEPSERLQFNFTEVTVSEAEVTADGLRGYAMVMGREPEKALAGAILDVAVEWTTRRRPTSRASLRSALERRAATRGRPCGRASRRRGATSRRWRRDTITLTPRAAREQRTFRALLNAMARPGSIAEYCRTSRGERFAALLAIAEALLDHEVTFAVCPERADPSTPSCARPAAASLRRRTPTTSSRGWKTRRGAAAGEGGLRVPGQRRHDCLSRHSPARGRCAGTQRPGHPTHRTLRVDGFSRRRGRVRERNAQPPWASTSSSSRRMAASPASPRYTTLIQEVQLMGYTAVRGGLERSSTPPRSSSRCREFRRAGRHRPVESHLQIAVGRVMAEGGLVDPELAALAIKQAEGDVIEAAFLLRAYRSTLPRLGYSHATGGSEMLVLRRISSVFRDIPGGQLLGLTRDYTQRLLNFELVERRRRPRRRAAAAHRRRSTCSAGTTRSSSTSCARRA